MSEKVKLYQFVLIVAMLSLSSCGTYLGGEIEKYLVFSHKFHRNSLLSARRSITFEF